MRFVATAGAQGGVQLRGAVSDDRMRTALESFAGARFGQVDSGLTMNADAPAGWTLRVIGALEAMAELQRGTATVTPDLIRIAGTTGSTTAAEATADKADEGARSEDIRAAEANWKRAEAGATLAEATYQRVQNLFNEQYTQVAFNTPFVAPQQMFSAFLAEPRTYGITVRGEF